MCERAVRKAARAYVRWVIDLLGAQAGDTLDDLYPGSGAVTRAWHAYTGQLSTVATRDASDPGRADASPAGPRDGSCAAVRNGSALAGVVRRG